MAIVALNAIEIMTAIRTVITIGVVVAAAAPALLALSKVIVKVTIIMVIAIQIITME